MVRVSRVIRMIIRMITIMRVTEIKRFIEEEEEEEE